jgi:hypothetical protein
MAIMRWGTGYKWGQGVIKGHPHKWGMSQRRWRFGVHVPRDAWRRG